jgi:hypothetical protein
VEGWEEEERAEVGWAEGVRGVGLAAGARGVEGWEEAERAVVGWVAKGRVVAGWEEVGWEGEG